MYLRKDILYSLVLLCCITAAAWIGWNASHYNVNDIHSGFKVCLFKRITGVPCPSCGDTRSLLYLWHLDFKDAFFANPFGFVLGGGILIFPFWVVYDLLARKSSFYRFYRKTELFVQKKWVAIILITIVMANWIWNIYKHY